MEGERERAKKEYQRLDKVGRRLRPALDRRPALPYSSSQLRAALALGRSSFKRWTPSGKRRRTRRARPRSGARPSSVLRAFNSDRPRGVPWPRIGRKQAADRGRCAAGEGAARGQHPHRGEPAAIAEPAGTDDAACMSPTASRNRPDRGSPSPIYPSTGRVCCTVFRDVRGGEPAPRRLYRA